MKIIESIQKELAKRAGELAKIELKEIQKTKSNLQENNVSIKMDGNYVIYLVNPNVTPKDTKCSYDGCFDSRCKQRDQIPNGLLRIFNEITKEEKYVIHLNNDEYCHHVYKINDQNDIERLKTL
jgi:hypothetical protein